MNSNSLILWRGPSAIDGQPIVLVATGLSRGSGNSKTGGMVQTFILRQDIHPQSAIVSGEDVSICGSCPHRRQADGSRTCYVRMDAPASVWRAFRAGSYRHASLTELRALRHRSVRAGTYGDPAAIPPWVWHMMLGRNRTGYTHRWRVTPELQGLVMASVDSDAEMHEAQRLGWRTFRVIPVGAPKPQGQALCPASQEAGKVTTCSDCLACDGSVNPRRSIYIPAHGGSRLRVLDREPIGAWPC